jgi:hypothetical protein
MLKELYQYIDQYGLNTTRILAIVGVTSLLLLFTVREIFSWFMKTSKLAKQFKVITKRLEGIESKLNQITLTMEQETEDSPETIKEAKKQFEFNH